MVLLQVQRASSSREELVLESLEADCSPVTESRLFSSHWKKMEYDCLLSCVSSHHLADKLPCDDRGEESIIKDHAQKYWEEKHNKR